MKQGFRQFAINSTFAEDMEKFCEKNYIKKWVVLETKNILGEIIILVEYHDYKINLDDEE